MNFASVQSGGAFASFLQVITISTLNFQLFSQLAFGFFLTPGMVLQTLMFSLVMGFVGGFLPAMEASRLKIVDALRAACMLANPSTGVPLQPKTR